MSEESHKRSFEVFARLINSKFRHVNQPGMVLLEDFVQARRAGQTVSEDTMAWIEAAFAQILAGKPADVALGIKRRRGRQLDPATQHREWIIFFNLVLLYEAGNTRDACFQILSHKYGVEEWLAADVWERKIVPLKLKRGVQSHSSSRKKVPNK